MTFRPHMSSPTSPTPLRVGILFGGPSREREVSFAGGRTVYDNLDKRLFAPVPLFVTAERRLIRLEWPYLYKGTVRDFWPPVSHYPEGAGAYQLSEESLGELPESDYLAMAGEVGTPVGFDELPDLIDVAFLALHGAGGEDGAVQGLLETLGIPYTGSGIVGSAVGMDKVTQKRLMAAGGFRVPPAVVVERREYDAFAETHVVSLFQQCLDELGTPLVVRGANQGSSIGVTILRDPTPASFAEALDTAFFRQRVDLTLYRALDPASRRTLVANIADLRHGIGFPLTAHEVTDAPTPSTFDPQPSTLQQPAQLQELLDRTDAAEVLLVGHHTESRAVVEGFLAGREVSTIVVRTDDGGALALLPTEIVKGGEVFDYRSKYLPGLSRKRTPADLPADQLAAVRREAERLFHYFEFDTYARIDGFVSAAGEVTLNDPNTTSGMLPSSFFFHQAAEIGLSPGEFLTYIIRTSLRERARRATLPNDFGAVADDLDARIDSLRRADDERRRVAVLLGGYSSERHISVESGRNIREKLASSGAYAPVPVFVARDEDSPVGHRLYALPINLLLKDNADDILAAVHDASPAHPAVAEVRELAAPLTTHFAPDHHGYRAEELSYGQLAERFDEVFIALHGRPGEDGEVQRRLEAVGLPYNGSGYDSSQITIDKYATLRRLAEAGLPVTRQRLVTAEEFAADPQATVRDVAEELGFPLIVKPVDDGCSSAVQKLDGPAELHDFLTLLLHVEPARERELRARLGIHPKDEIPAKPVALCERLIARGDADLFLEITGGMLTRYGDDGELEFQVFEPSEALSTGSILTLEEKFLAGEGQNITPARFAFDGVDYEHVASRVRATLERVARIVGVEGYSRIDAFVRAWRDGRVETVVIEVNSLPGMTPATVIYHQAALAGMTPFQFIDRILAFGRERAAAGVAG